jgi:hypothetical protein
VIYKTNSNERNNITRIDSATCALSLLYRAAKHQYESIEFVLLNARPMMPARGTRVNRRWERPAIKNQAPGSALIRADKRDSLRPTVLA